MQQALVVGRLWASIRSRKLEGKKLLLVAPLDGDGRPTGKLIVALDSVQCSQGQKVLLTYGSGARRALENERAVSDVCVLGIVGAPG